MASSAFVRVKGYEGVGVKQPLVRAARTHLSCCVQRDTAHVGGLVPRVVFFWLTLVCPAAIPPPPPPSAPPRRARFPRCATNEKGMTLNREDSLAQLEQSFQRQMGAGSVPPMVAVAEGDTSSLRLDREDSLVQLENSFSNQVKQPTVPLRAVVQ